MSEIECHLAYRRSGASWRSGYATVCKTDRFSFENNALSENRALFAPIGVNRLARISERSPEVRGQLRCRRRGAA
jgi:hypothetical protein